MNTTTYIRKPFSVEAVQVTAENLAAVAEWCGGEVVQEDKAPYVKVRVQNPLNDRQSKAYIGDWILYASKGYKVYTRKAFEKSFEPEGTPRVSNVFVDQGSRLVMGGTKYPSVPSETVSSGNVFDNRIETGDQHL